MKVVSGDLSAMKTSVSTVLVAEITDADNTIEALDNFINEIGPGTKLTGRAYDEIKEQLSSYREIMTKRKSLASNLKNSIDSAISSMNNYMGEYSELDDAELDDIIASIEQANSAIGTLKAQLADSALPDSEKGSIRSSISGYESTLSELRRKKEKLEGLGSADSTAWSTLADTVSDLTAYGSSVSNVV